MTLAEIILEKSKDLSPAKAQEVIDFIDFIKHRPSSLPAEADRRAAIAELARANLHWEGKPIPDRDALHDGARG